MAACASTRRCTVTSLRTFAHLAAGTFDVLFMGS